MGLFTKLLKTTLTIVETPIAVVKDVATMGGVMNDEPISYTEKKFREIECDYDDFKNEL